LYFIKETQVLLDVLGAIELGNKKVSILFITTLENVAGEKLMGSPRISKNTITRQKAVPTQRSLV
jgi:hypothetical protein